MACQGSHSGFPTRLHGKGRQLREARLIGRAVPQEAGMLPEKLFFWRSSILRDDMAEFWPQEEGSVPVREFPLKSSVCSSGSVCLPPWPHLHPSMQVDTKTLLVYSPCMCISKFWDSIVGT